ncbi:hypothetical protein LCGC14_2496150 [marine sediment metagenome]|uniref:Capsid protein n=1 Tax=marine sediment metagenome TaxID=412755 RepID=A0A0F9B417_9ZZZZ
MPGTTAADLTAGQIAMVATARYTYERIAVTANVFNKMMLGPGEKSKYIPKFASGGAAQDLQDGVDMTTETALTITGTVHTTDEAGAKVIITKKLANQLKEDVFVAAGRIVGNMIGRKIDTDGVGLFSGLDTTVGAGGSVLTLGHMAAAIAQMLGQSEPVPQPYVMVHHPHSINGIVDQITVPSATLTFPDALSLPLLREYWRGQEKLYGVNIFVDGNITFGTSTNGAMFSPLAFLYLVGWEPENWLEYDNSLRGWEIGVVADYLMAEEDGTYGRVMLNEGAAPVA